MNRVNQDVINHLKPIGPVGNEKFTISIDTEGCGISYEIGSIHVSGWCSRNLRVQTIYYAEIQLELVPNPATWISGLQQQDLENGSPKETVKNNLLAIIKDKRIITHGPVSEIFSLGLTSVDLRHLNYENVNLQTLFFTNFG